jgi:hypothetical protein
VRINITARRPQNISNVDLASIVAGVSIDKQSLWPVDGGDSGDAGDAGETGEPGETGAPPELTDQR